MEFWTRLKSLPAKLTGLAKHAYGSAGEALRPIFGTFTWTPPGWVPALAAAIRMRRRELTIGGATAAGLLLAGWLGLEWYLHRPHPPEPARITFDAQSPQVTDYENSDGTPAFIVHPVDVHFSASAAPIELVGKPVSRGIAMNPVIKGTWKWLNDRTLRFTPAQDWPVGAHFEVQFDVAQAFAPHVLMADDHLSFDAAAFQATAGEGEFYQDPQIPAAKKTIMPVSFNYPVDPVEFEKRISLALKGRAGSPPAPLKFTVIYDAAKIKAWIHSQPLELPRDDDRVRLTLESGVRSSRGGAGTENPVKLSVRLPGLYSLAINSISPTLVNNDRFEPEQVLVVTSSDAVRGEDLAKLAKAWVLPKRKPGRKTADSAPPYAWNVDEVGEPVLRHSEPLKLEAVPTEKDYDEQQSFKFHATPGQRVYVRFAPGLKSFGGFLLGKARAEAFTVPDYPKLLRFVADGSLLSLSGDRHVSVVSRNEPGMRVEVGRVMLEQLQHLVSFNEGTYAQPELNGSFSEDHIVERFEQTQTFPAGDPGEAHYTGVDLGQYLKDGKHGVFLLHLSAYDPAKAKKPEAADNAADSEDSDAEGDEDDSSSDESDSGPTDTRLIVITDLGLLAKRELDGSRDVFVQSLRTGQPAGSATVSVLALNGETLYSATSSPDGQVHFPSLKGLEREKRPVLYIVTKGDDLSFLPIDSHDRRLDYSRFDIGGEANAVNESQLSAYLFSDRGIYRPGDLFHVGIIVRTAGWSQSPAGIPLRAEIVDPRGLTVKKLPVPVDASGFTELAYTPAETAPTGTWTVNLYIEGKDADEAAIGSTTVSVKEFLPDSMKVVAGLSAHVADGWVKPDRLKAYVDVQNLFGTPAATRRVEASLTLSPTFPAFRNWADYQFYDLRHAKDGYTTQMQDGRTDEHGHAQFDLDLKKYADATYRLVFLAKAYEAEGGRSVAASAETLVSNNPWLVGYKAGDDLSYIRRGSARSVHLVAIDPQTRPIALNGLQAQLIERRYVSVLTKQESGVYKYESRLKEIPVGAAALSISADGLDYTLPTGKPGDFALLIRSGNATVNRVEYTVAGEANLSRALERNAELQIKLDKEDYAPGESIEISLRAPYPGSGLITVERDKVYAHAWFTARDTASVQHIAVPAGFEGNGYINVQFIRDPSSDEVFMSPLSYGVAPFSVNVDARRNAVQIEAPDIVKPGQTATFKLHAARPTKAVLFAVDEGILQVARYKLGDPLKFFFRKRMLEVQTAQILDLILPDFKKLMAMAAPGGDAGDSISRQLNPFKRRRDNPVAYWSGIVDVNGEKDLQYTVPDYFHGKLHLMAVAVSPNLIGVAEGATTVRGDFVLSPDAPTTLAPGDEAEIGLGVSNNLTGAGLGAVPVAVQLRTGPQLRVIGAGVQNIVLAPMHEGSVRYRVKATATLGSGSLSFTASYGGKSSAQRVDISVRPASAYRTQIDVARVGPYNGGVTVKPLRRMYDAYSRRQVGLSPAPLALTAGMTAWLVDYDNYCSEQIVSAAMPHMLATKWTLPILVQALRPAAPANKQQADALASQIDVLRSRQNEQGGFGVWAPTPDADPFISAYAMHFLLEARDRNVAVPKEMIEAGDRYLQQMANDDGMNSLDELRQRAYAVYLLTRQGNVTSNALAGVQKRLQEAYPKIWKDDLAAAWMAASFKLLKQDNEADRLIGGLQRELERSTDDEVYSFDYYDDPLIRDSTVLYLLAKHFPERARSLSPRVMDNIARPIERDEFNTLSAAMTMLAFDAYGAMNATAVQKLGIEQIDAKGVAKPIAISQNNVLQAASWNASVAALRFTNASPLPAWSVVDQAGYDRDIPSQAIKNGIEIVRDYSDIHGNAVAHIALGEEIDVHIKIRATSQKGLDDVAIVDLLPGGFDPVIQQPPEAAQARSEEEGGAPAASGWTIRQAGSSWTPVNTDVREDRVVIYGSATPNVQEFVYRIKAAAAGTFAVPPAYGESMYDRRVQARSPGGGTLTVTRVP